MRLLAFNTTTATCSVAIWCDGSIEASHCSRMVHGQAEALLPSIERVLAEAGQDYDSIDRIAVTVGPGSFTGVRVGIATARSLSAATGCPAIGILTTAVLAKGAAQNVSQKPIAVAIDARRAEVYLQQFDKLGQALGEPQCLLPEIAAERLGSAAWRLVGDGVNRIAQFLDWNPPLADPTQPDLSVLAAMAAAEIPVNPPRPAYVRPPDAVIPKDGGRIRP